MRVVTGLAIAFTASVCFIIISMYQAVKDFYDEPDAFWE